MCTVIYIYKIYVFLNIIYVYIYILVCIGFLESTAQSRYGCCHLCRRRSSDEADVIAHVADVADVIADVGVRRETERCHLDRDIHRDPHPLSILADVVGVED